MSEKKIIEVHNLSKEYKLGMVVENVSFDIERGGIYGLVGPNGAGKTTIMKMLGGLVIPTEGTISMFGNSDRQNLEAARRRMSFMIEIPYVKKDHNARYNLERTRILKGIEDKNRIDEILDMVGLSDVSSKKIVKKYSLGMQQRLGIANALLHQPEVLILDEPTNGLDPEGIVEIRNLLLKLNREEKITILISSHILSELSLLCTDYLFINHGRIIKSISDDNLKKECSGAVHIHTRDDESAVDVIKTRYPDLQPEITDYMIIIPEAKDIVYELSKLLYDNGIVPVHISVETQDLEEYYLSLLAK